MPNPNDPNTPPQEPIPFEFTVVIRGKLKGFTKEHIQSIVLREISWTVAFSNQVADITVEAAPLQSRPQLFVPSHLKDGIITPRGG